ncbi:unnamed protein product [Gongylonema pulchrum]|uniref:RALGAPB_N domain-containing protein n=1 Tax=Gongylonema pulchrum TaxID=637853 RepID=A0A183EGI3_9BILA|nr:unnamed protein product [Gongylonema pulchrum]
MHFFFFLSGGSLILLSAGIGAQDVASVVASKLTQTLLDEFLCASLLEQIPSPPYWKTLSFLSRRWRHQVSFIENWARKVLSLSVLIVQEIYGENYCTIKITDDQVKLFSAEAKKPAESVTMPVLHVCWFQLMHLIGNPADIISHDPRIAGALPANPLRALLTTGE